MYSGVTIPTDMINFMPSGFLVFVANEEIIELTMTVEEGIKFIISVGIVTLEYNQQKILKLKKDFQA